MSCPYFLERFEKGRGWSLVCVTPDMDIAFAWASKAGRRCRKAFP